MFPLVTLAALTAKIIEPCWRKKFYNLSKRLTTYNEHTANRWSSNEWSLVTLESNNTATKIKWTYPILKCGNRDKETKNVLFWALNVFSMKGPGRKNRNKSKDSVFLWIGSKIGNRNTSYEYLLLTNCPLSTLTVCTRERLINCYAVLSAVLSLSSFFLSFYLSYCFDVHYVTLNILFEWETKKTNSRVEAIFRIRKFPTKLHVLQIMRTRNYFRFKNTFK